MISVQEAKQLVRQYTKTSKQIDVDLYQAIGYASADDIFSPINFPTFKQSAMDGYAFRFDDWLIDQSLHIAYEVQAGDTSTRPPLQKGEAVRIFTGAKVPDETDTVVMQEHVEQRGTQLFITNKNISQGANVRPIASQTKLGECILKKGSEITPGAVGLLASVGLQSIAVHEKPKCIILTTGKELVPPGSSLQDGQIFESNSYALALALQQLHLVVIEIISVDDIRVEIEMEIQRALEQADILLITGGVSVGDYDFVSDALEKNNVEKVFHMVKQKPGKPLYFGKKTILGQEKLIFGLPGNPGSVLTCFYEYVLPCIKSIMGFINPDLTSIKLPLVNVGYTKQSFTHFLKGKLVAGGVEMLDNQESYKMNAFAKADCLVVIPEDQHEISMGMMVEIHLLKS